MTLSTTNSEGYENASDVHRLRLGEKEFIVVGTAHISGLSAELVENVIRNERPDCVCVELDHRRYESLLKPNHWENLDLKELIKKKQLSTLIIQITLASFQKRLGDQTGVIPGTEMMAAINVSKSLGIAIELCDRDARITLKRAWRLTAFTKKAMLISSLFASLFDRSSVNEDNLKNIRQQDVISELLKELGKSFPSFKRVLIDERDRYLATRTKLAPGERIVTVVGAGHVQGILRHLQANEATDLSKLEEIPPSSTLWKWGGWGIPLMVIGALLWIGVNKGPETASENAAFWVLANGFPCALGAVIALANPFTIITAFLVAPFTSLSPVIGAGYVTALVQAWLCPPRVREFQNVADDIVTVSHWWSNRLLKIFLVFLLTGLGSVVGTWIGGVKIFKDAL